MQRDTALRDPFTRRRRSARSSSHDHDPVQCMRLPYLGHFHQQALSIPDRHPPLSAENSKGVKSITRKVIKRLEGLGHLEMVDMDMSLPEEDKQLDEDVMLPLLHSRRRLYTTPSSFPPQTLTYRQRTGYMPPNSSPPTTLMLAIYPA